jgi:hypothetical protein
VRAVCLSADNWLTIFLLLLARGAGRSRAQAARFLIEESQADDEKPDCNVAPTKTTPTVLAQPPRGRATMSDPCDSCGT